jgi:hypothetical protein
MVNVGLSRLFKSPVLYSEDEGHDGIDQAALEGPDQGRYVSRGLSEGKAKGRVVEMT